MAAQLRGANAHASKDMAVVAKTDLDFGLSVNSPPLLEPISVVQGPSHHGIRRPQERDLCTLKGSRRTMADRIERKALEGNNQNKPAGPYRRSNATHVVLSSSRGGSQIQFEKHSSGGVIFFYCGLCRAGFFSLEPKGNHQF